MINIQKEIEWLKSHLMYLTCSSNFVRENIPEIIEVEEKIEKLSKLVILNSSI